jgi:predicted DNA-binding transcriptional regulator YafY
LLQERSPRDARALSAALDAIERTVYRDLKVLELAGVGCDNDPGLGGYVLRRDYRFAVAGLSDDELLGQATGPPAPASGEPDSVAQAGRPSTRRTSPHSYV